VPEPVPEIGLATASRRDGQPVSPGKESGAGSGGGTRRARRGKFPPRPFSFLGRARLFKSGVGSPLLPPFPLFWPRARGPPPPPPPTPPPPPRLWPRPPPRLRRPRRRIRSRFRRRSARSGFRS